MTPADDWVVSATPTGSAIENVTFAACIYDDDGVPRAYANLSKNNAEGIVAAVRTYRALVDDEMMPNALEEFVAAEDEWDRTDKRMSRLEYALRAVIECALTRGEG